MSEAAMGRVLVVGASGLLGGGTVVVAARGA